MAYENIQQFIEKIESIGELHRISALVDPVLEITKEKPTWPIPTDSAVRINGRL